MKYYGTLESDKGSSTRAGHRYVKASAQTHDGSVTVHIENGVVTIRVRDGSGVGGRPILIQSLATLLNADHLAVYTLTKVDQLAVAAEHNEESDG